MSVPPEGGHPSRNQLYSALDEARLGRSHRLMVLTAGMGFFADAYDLFIIGTVTAILSPLWHLTTGQLSLLNSISLLASVVGAITFGRLMDLVGRKAMYGTEVALLVLGALASAFAGSFSELLIFRVVVGLGVGGDYATSAVITAEYANRRDRGRMVGTVFAMQGFGLLAGPLVASVLLAAGVPHGLAWRVMLGLGALPAASVVYLRRRIRETPRFTLGVRGDVSTTAKTVLWTTGREVAGTEAPRPAPPQRGPAQLVRRPLRRRLIGTAGCWLLLDIAFYGNGVSSQVILKALFGHASLLHNTVVAALIFLIFAVPGYWVAVWLLDRIGRRRVQWQGFLVMALGYASIFLAPGLIALPLLFLLVYGLTYFFIEFGPNMTTFVLPAELFPVRVRGLADGISAGAGKLGAFVAALSLPTAVAALGLPATMGILAVVSVAGVLLTLGAVPETAGQSLEHAAGEEGDDQPEAPAAASALAS